MTDRRRAVGLAGEAAAASFLEGLGYRIVEHGWRCRAGEIDLVAEDGDVLVFVEVKARGGEGFGTPAESVTPSKRRRLARLAAWFLAERNAHERRCRFDVVEVRGDDVHHLADAFRPGWDG